MTENHLSKKGSLKNKMKLILAKEIIYVCIVSIICFTIYKLGDYWQNKYSIELKTNTAKIEGLPQHQLLWYKLKKHKLYYADYSDFKEEFKNTESQILLFKLVSNNGLYTKDFDEFRVKYFKKESVIDDCYALYYNENRLYKNNILYQDKSFWDELRRKEKEFKSLLKNKAVLNEMYQIFVSHGYGKSKEEFKKLLFEPYKEGLDMQKINNLEMEINKVDPRYPQKAENVIILILLLFYPLRYLGIIIKWSVKQIQKNSFEN